MANPALPDESLRVEVLDRAGFDALEPEWLALLERTSHDAPFYTHAFLRCWLDAFAKEKPIRCIAVRDASGLRAALVLVERREGFYGLPATVLSGAANVHSARFDLVARADDPAAIQAVWSALAELDWDVLELPDVPPEGAARALIELAKTAGRTTGLWESMQTPFIPLGVSKEALMERLTAKFRSNLRRRRKKLAEQGDITFERYTGGPELDAKLDEGFALEAAGWKGKEGTAISSDAATRAFYSALAHASAKAGTLSLFFLRAGGRAVAFYFALTHAGICVLPKLGFDESLSQASPGHLILEDVLADCCDRGLREFDFLGPNMPWKQEWTDKVRVHHWCYAFGDSLRGRALHAAKFKVAPGVKATLSEVWPWKR
jgi:CelD/BcsL family acetyltransferase involved in cellulose biosynthesis